MIVTAVLIVTVSVAAKGSNSRRVQAFGELITRAETAEKVVALTFDDGPTAGHTEAILAILAERGVPATFFLCGADLARHPEQGRAIVEAGHQVANHSYDHPRMWFRAPGDIRSQLDRTDDQIRRAGYSDRIDFRPPYGKKLLVLPWTLQQRGTRTIMWDVAPERFDGGPAQTAEQLAELAVAQTRPGSIILLHPMHGREPSRQAAAMIINRLSAQGYRFVTVADLVGR